MCRGAEKPLPLGPWACWTDAGQVLRLQPVAKIRIVLSADTAVGGLAGLVFELIHVFWPIACQGPARPPGSHVALLSVTVFHTIVTT